MNTDGASKGNLGRRAIGFALRNEDGNLLYTCGKVIDNGTNTEAEANAIVEAIRYCVHNNFVLIDLHTDSLIIKNAVQGIWSTPWVVTREVEEIKILMSSCNASISHTLREGNRLANHLANYALDVGPISCSRFGDLDIQGRRILNDDKSQCPYLRIRVDGT